MKMRDTYFLGLVLLILFAVWFGMTGCQTLPQSPAPVVKPSPTPAPAASPEPEETMTVEQADPSLDSIKAMAAKSSCASYYFKDRGHAPKGYYKGMALAYAKALCHPESDVTKVVGKAEATDKVEDAMAHYDLSGDQLLNTFTLLIGLGLRESSGKYCCGRDMSANFSSADSAEAGIFQTSWGAHSTKKGERAGGALSRLFDKYNSNASGCFLVTFSEGAKCSTGDAKNWGSGKGFEWQALTKKCPMFATEYAAILLRTHGGSVGEFGPVRRKAAEFRPECKSLLSQVKDVVLSNPKICALL